MWCRAGYFQFLSVFSTLIDFPLGQRFLLLRFHLATLEIQHNSPSVKPCQSAEAGDLREASISSLGSVTVTLSLAGECVYANDCNSG
jgi:hypothetical protein